MIYFHPWDFSCRHCNKGAELMHPELLNALDALREEYGKPMIVTCGYRCPEHNTAVGGAPNSAHLTGEAVDISDKDGALKAFCTDEVLQKFNLFMEDPASCSNWAHLQSRPTKSGNRVFKK